MVGRVEGYRDDMDPLPPARSSTSLGAEGKSALRARLLAARRGLSLDEIAAAAQAVAAHLSAWQPLRDAATVAAYVAVGSEPGTGPLLEQLALRGARVLLPVVRPDLDLDWATHDGRLASARLGLLEPEGHRLGVEAVATSDVVVVPGLAADRHGRRLGRGGGCYDRALARVPAGTPVVVVLYDDELLDVVPTEPHDRMVTAVCTPAGLTVLPQAPA